MHPTSTVVFKVLRKLDKTTLEADAHADTTCLGRGATHLYHYNFPINVQDYGTVLGAKHGSTVSGGLLSTHPFVELRYHLIVH